MPIFDYVCLTCGKEEEFLVKHEDADKMQHCTCRQELCMVRKNELYATGLQFKGKWYKTTKGY